ncbi:MAG: heavy metal translocating P-type ATPase [Bacteroidota bacterium]
MLTINDISSLFYFYKITKVALYNQFKHLVYFNMIKTEIFFVEGMTCASCVAKVEKAIKSVDGVIDVAVNLASEKVKIEIENENIEKIFESVASAGYKLLTISSEKNIIDLQKETFKKMGRELLLSVVLTIPITLISMFSMSEWFVRVVPLSMENINYILFAMTLIVILTSGRKFYKIALKLALKKTSDMNTLVAVGTGVAFLYSASVTFFPKYFSLYNIQHSDVYFDTTATIITLILLGKYFETRAKIKMIDSISSLVSLQPKVAHILKDGTIEDVSVDFVKVGEIFILKPGEKIPFDAVIESGSTTIDESMITGESLPTEKNIGDKIIGGTINFQGSITAKILAVGKNMLLSHIVSHVEKAQSSKAQIQGLADKVTSIFVPIIFAISISTFLISYFIFEIDFIIALLNSIAVLIIACPCALGLATPTALIVATGKAARKGILVKNAESLERSCNIQTVVFDKTGTLTEGMPKVNSFEIFFGFDEKYIFQLLFGIEQSSEHPIAKSIVKYLKEKNILPINVENFEAKIGVGALAFYENIKLVVGNKKLLNEENILIPEKYQKDESHLTKIFFAVDRKIACVMFLSDTVQENAREVIESLKKEKVDVMMLSGDTVQSAKQIAEKLGIVRFMAMVSPMDKSSIIKSLQSKKEIVAMVGDGINDAPALAQADVSIALGRGTEIAMETADITLMRNNLNGVLEIIKLSRQTMRTIKQNLFWAFIYNIICIPLAAVGFLSPTIASLAMATSSISVILNSLRLKIR